MAADAASDHVIILSDSERLARLIEFGLDVPKVSRYVFGPVGTACRRIDAAGCRLIILALSSLSSEPIVALARASLIDCIGRVPMLVISDKPFSSDSVDPHLL